MTDYDARKYKCAPWHGQRGPSWERIFKPQFENCLRGERDNFNNMHQYLFGKDFGGWDATAPPHIAGAGALAAQNALSIQARISRGDTFINLIKTHILNQDIVDAIDVQYTALVGAAPIAAAAGGPGGAAVANQLPTDWAFQLWDWIHTNFGQARQTGLLISNQDSTWANCKISDVGIDRETIRKFYAHLLRLNRERQNQLPILTVWTKFMSQITFPRVLADRAMAELQNPTFVFAGGPNVGQPDLSSAVQAFEEIWQNVYDRGIEIKPQKAPEPRGPPSNRVDGMHANTITMGDNIDYGLVCSPCTEADVFESFAVTAGSDAFAFLKDERNCWICHGWGHTKDKCPSTKRPRPLSACIQGLQQLQAQQNERLRNMQGARRVRRPGPSPRAAPRANQQSNSAETLIEYDDGGVYTADGTEIVAPTPVTPAPDSGAGASADSGTGAIPGMHSSQAVIAPEPEKTIETLTEKSEPVQQEIAPAITYANMDAEIERQFQSSMHMASATDSPVDEFVRTERSRNSALLVACTTVFAIAGAVAMGIRSGRGKALLTLLALAPTHGMLMPSAKPAMQVHSSIYSRSNCMDMQVKDGNQSRDHGILDSGTTQCASGRRKLFPDHLIEKYNPPIQVEIGNGVLLRVAMLGSIELRCRAGRSAKKLISIMVPHSFYVPQMPVTLISTKALFRMNIRTYFNDELIMILPNNDVVEFVETPTNYTLLFAGDSAKVPVVRKPSSVVESLHSANAATTLREPLPLTWELIHSRFVHFSLPKISASAPYLENIPFKDLGTLQHGQQCVCPACVRGAFRGHRKGNRPAGKFVYFGQRVYSDSCKMPKSTPFGWTYMYIFLDAYSKFIAVYFGRSTTSAEMILVFKQYVTDYSRYMKNGRVDEWYTDGGPEFASDSIDVFCVEMSTRHRFIAPWNPWMNVAETGWRILLRPLRIVLAASNASRALWPFAINQICMVHNALISHSSSATEGFFAQAFIASTKAGTNGNGASPYFLVTGKKFDASILRTMFCACDVRIRNKDDLRNYPKTDPLTYRAMHLGVDSRCVGYLVYLLEKQRFTTSSFNDTVFFEDKMPRLDKIVGQLDMNGTNAYLPTEEQQNAEISGDIFPELDDVTASQSQLPQQPADPSQQPANPNPPNPNNSQPAHRDHVAPGWSHSDATDTRFSASQCTNPRCQIPSTKGNHNDGDPRHSFERFTGRTRRDASNLLHALDTDSTGVLVPSGHHACVVGSVETENGEILIGYNAELAAYGDVQLPNSTREALNGPQKTEWMEAYQRDLTAKIKNKTFTYVRRPTNRKVIKTKVAHALKRDEITNAISELRARWVGMGFLQGLGDFKDTYCATPNATSVRLFLCMVLQLTLSLAQGDVTKAFTLNPIDVEIYVEQMPGMETVGDFPGATVENTVCLLHKCLEGLKQAGNVWQTTHTAFLVQVTLFRVYKFVQSTIDPCVFVCHCSKGLVIILVWIDDILVGYSTEALYNEFVRLYEERFPSKHKKGCNKFAGIAIDYKPKQSLTIHQISHIELAYDKFIVDKAAAQRSPAVHRLAIADKDSPRHYSKLNLAGSDQERSAMKSKPFLPALATVMYYSHWVLPHINYHCSYLGQYMHDPSLMCMESILDIIIYTYYHRHQDVITYEYANFTMPRQIPESRRAAFMAAFGLHGFCDASWLLRSVGGFIVFMCNAPLDWSSKGIRVICHSSAESEIAAGCVTGKRAVYIVQLTGEMSVKIMSKFILLIDNTAANDLSKKLGVQSRTAHFLRWQHYLRWLVVHGYVEIFFIPTKEQVADMFTKVLDMSTFLFFCRMLYSRRRLSKP